MKKKHIAVILYKVSLEKRDKCSWMAMFFVKQRTVFTKANKKKQKNGKIKNKIKKI
jgi:hypothetical protein